MLVARCNSTRRGAGRRKGTAAVELAVCLPLLISVAIGSIEATNAIFVMQHCTSAAYEGARTAIAPGQTTAGATTSANAILNQFGLTGGSVTVTPSVTASTAVGTQVTVSVSVPFSSNSWVPAFILGKVLPTIQATVVMIHQ
jgi:Flp pilus assembly protein TadG